MPLASELDVRAVLPTIRVPTLVIQHAADVVFLPAWGNDCRRKARRCSFEGCERVACHGDGTTGLPGAWDRACPVAGRVVMVACRGVVRQFGVVSWVVALVGFWRCRYDWPSMTSS